MVSIVSFLLKERRKKMILREEIKGKESKQETNCNLKKCHQPVSQWYGYQVFKFQSPVYSYANSFIMKAWYSWTIYNIFPVNEIIIQTLAGKNIRNAHYCKCISHISTQHKGNIMQQFCLPIFSDFKENHRSSWIYLFILFISTLRDTHSKSFHPHPRWNQWEFCIDFSATTILVAVSTLSLSGLREVLKKSVKLHHGDPTHYSHFSWGKGKKCFYSLGKLCRSSRGTICVESISSTHQQASLLTGSNATVENKHVFFNWFVC